IECFFFSSRRRHTSFSRDWSSDVCSSDLGQLRGVVLVGRPALRRVVGHRGRSLPSAERPPHLSTSPAPGVLHGTPFTRPASGRRSEERRVGKESRSGGSTGTLMQAICNVY